MRAARVQPGAPDGAGRAGVPRRGDAADRDRARALCEALGKTPVEVPDIPGFVVNRLLFPYLFSAVELMSETGMQPEDVDSCMKLGAGMPMGPLALLDFVGLDVALAIGEAIHIDVPEKLVELVGDGALGRKSGHGFYSSSNYLGLVHLRAASFLSRRTS